MTDIKNIWQFDLRRGSGTDPATGACLLDAVSWLEYGHLGDHPECVCPVIAEFGRQVNDALNGQSRQRLKPYIPRLIGTVDPAAEYLRAEYLVWQAVRVFAPTEMEALGCADAITQSLLRCSSLLDAYRMLFWIEYNSGSRAAPARYSAAAAVSCLLDGMPTGAAGGAGISALSALRFPDYRNDVGAAIFATLDGVLAIGKQADPEPQAGHYERAAREFAEAADA